MVTEGSWDPVGHTYSQAFSGTQSTKQHWTVGSPTGLQPPPTLCFSGGLGPPHKAPATPKTSGPTPSSLSPSLPHQFLFPGASLCT